ncbi:hypothetical protein J27TS7_23430 [Paenibacillus dendritiformis]|nr:hypothetical protein J27TS7_23430 [Paenibacillus dendritiformis]
MYKPGEPFFGPFLVPVYSGNVNGIIALSCTQAFSFMAFSWPGSGEAVNWPGKLRLPSLIQSFIDIT